MNTFKEPTLEEKIKLIEAEAAGKEIEFCTYVGWVTKTKGSWDFSINYRIKPRIEKVEVKRWVNVYSEGSTGSTYITKSDANKCLNDGIIACVEMMGSYERIVE